MTSEIVGVSERNLVSLDKWVGLFLHRLWQQMEKQAFMSHLHPLSCAGHTDTAQSFTYTLSCQLHNMFSTYFHSYAIDAWHWQKMVIWYFGDFVWYLDNILLSVFMCWYFGWFRPITDRWLPKLSFIFSVMVSSWQWQKLTFSLGGDICHL